MNPFGQRLTPESNPRPKLKLRALPLSETKLVKASVLILAPPGYL